MAVRLGIKISGGTISQTPIPLVDRFKSFSCFGRSSSNSNVSTLIVRNASGVTGRKNLSSPNKRDKKAKEFSSFDRPEKERRRDFVSEYDAVEQYELEAAKPRDKSGKTNEVYEFMTKMQRNQSIRILPHLQPNNLKPYGSTDNIIFPEILKPRDWVKYPSMDQIDEMSNSGSQDKQDYRSYDKVRPAKYSKSYQAADANADPAEDLGEYEAESHDSAPCDKCSGGVPWPSYGDSIRPKDGMLTSSEPMNMHQNRKFSTNISSSVVNNNSNPPINFTVKDPLNNVNELRDPVVNVEIREPISIISNNIQARRRGPSKKPPEAWDNYCPEEEIEEKCIIPRKEKKLPKLIPKDCPCIEPPEPCDVPPLPRLNLEVCEPRPECPQPCDEATRADEDCWEYLEDAKIDCRTIPHIKKGVCSKCDLKKSMRKDPACRGYGTRASGFGESKRHYSTLNSEKVSSIQSLCHPCAFLPEKCVDDQKQTNNLDDFWQSDYGLAASINDANINYNNKSNIVNTVSVQKNRLYSTKNSDADDKQCCCNETACKKFEVECHSDIPPYLRKECPRFCLPCPLVHDISQCTIHGPVCCDKTLPPYPSYSECVVTYITPFSNEPNYVCKACGRNPRMEEFCCKKYSTYAGSSLLMKPDLSNTGKRHFSLFALRKPADHLVLSKKSLKAVKMWSDCPPRKKDNEKACLYCGIRYPHCQSDPCRQQNPSEASCFLQPQTCRKMPTPYPSFSECMLEDFQDYLTECPSSLEANKELQPDSSPIPVSQITLEPQKFVKLDPTKEEKCIREKFCFQNNGVSQSCYCFGRPHVTLKSKDYLPRSDHFNECEKAHFVHKIIVPLNGGRNRGYHGMPLTRIISKSEESKNQNSSLAGIINRNLSTTHFRIRYEKGKQWPTFQLNCLKQDSKNFAGLKINLLNNSLLKNNACKDCFVNFYNQIMKIKSQLDLSYNHDTKQGIILCRPIQQSDLKSLIRTIHCPTGCSTVEKKPEERVIRCSKCDCEHVEDSCTNVDKCFDTKKQPLYQRILDCIYAYFRARPNCPSPEECRRRRLIVIAEKAAKKAGMALCDPNQLKCKESEEYPKVITPDKCCQEQQNPCPEHKNELPPKDC